MELEEQIKLTNRFANKSKELQDRIDKAIEYIEKYADEYFTCVEDTEVWDKEIKDLYEILKGE